MEEFRTLFQTLLIWLAMGFVCAYMAHRKGYPIYLLLFVCLALGPFGILLVLLLPRTRDARIRDNLHQMITLEERRHQEQQSCPACHQKISSEAWVCGLCGYQFVKIE